MAASAAGIGRSRSPAISSSIMHQVPNAESSNLIPPFFTVPCTISKCSRSHLFPSLNLRACLYGVACRGSGESHTPQEFLQGSSTRQGAHDCAAARAGTIKRTGRSWPARCMPACMAPADLRQSEETFAREPVPASVAATDHHEGRATRRHPHADWSACSRNQNGGWRLNGVDARVHRHQHKESPMHSSAWRRH